MGGFREFAERVVLGPPTDTELPTPPEPSTPARDDEQDGDQQ
jgi:hypothetical protein